MTQHPNNRWWNQCWFLGLVLVVAIIFAYQPAWQAGFIWDDDDHLTANPAMTAPHGLRMIWSSLAVSRYYPLTLTSFWLQHRLWGLNPVPYHLLNIALHAINGFLVFLVLRRLRVTAAWLASALWVLHPVNVESVAWITELKNTQSAVFLFCALLCFLRSEQTGRHRWYAAALLSAAAAVLSKPSTVVLPLALLLCVWWERGRVRWTDFARTVPFFVLSLLMSVLTIVEQRQQIAVQRTAEWSLGIAERFIIAGKDVWFYAAKILWPVNLAFVYPRWATTAHSIGSWMPLAGVVAVAIVLWNWRRQSWARASLFGVGFFLVALLPVLGFIDVYYFRYSFVADHFQYLAGLGIIALAAAGVARVLERNRLWQTPAGNAMCAILLAVLAGLTWGQARVYRNNETIWRDVLAKNPDTWMAHNNLGLVLEDQGKPAEAKEHYEATLRLKADYPEGYNNLGNALVHLDRAPEAIAQYEQAIRIKPDYAEAHNNLGVALLQKGRVDEAITHLEKALGIESDYADAHNNLGNALVEKGRFDKAIIHYQKALEIQPDFAEAHYDLGNTLFRQGNVDGAISHYQKALAIAPDHVRARDNLGWIFLQMGRADDAITQFQRALEIQPDYADTHNKLGYALQQIGRTDEAITHFQQALKVLPDFAEAHNNLGNALLDKGHVNEAMAHFQKALEIKPDYADAHNNLGYALQQIGRTDEAITHFQQALKVLPDFAEAHNNLGNALLQKGRVDEAIAHYHRALEIQPGLAKAHNNLGWSLLQIGRADEAIAQFQKALEIQPHYPDALSNLGVALFQTGREEEAITDFEKALQIQPDSVEAHSNLGRALLQKGRGREAAAHFQTVVELQPDNARALSNLAWVLATCPDGSVRDGPKAVELAQRAIGLSDGQDPVILRALAAAYAEAGRFAEAVTAGQRALQLAGAQSNTALVETLRSQVKQYQANRPIRDTGLTTSAANQGQP